MATRTITAQDGSTTFTYDVSEGEIEAVMKQYGITDETAIYFFEKTLEYVNRYPDDQVRGMANMTRKILSEAAGGHERAQDFIGAYYRTALPAWMDAYDQALTLDRDPVQHFRANFLCSKEEAVGFVAIVKLAKEGASMKKIIEVTAEAGATASVEDIMARVKR